jgi:FlaG/FlaF family flagellin (archaellin)
MVAITVVLAAVLYVMVTGLIGGSTGGAPNVTFGNLQGTGSGAWSFQIAGVSRSESLAQYQVTVLNGTTVAIQASGSDLTSCETTPWCTGGGLTLKFTDLTGDEKLNSGDFFDLSGGDTTSDYTVKLIWKQSGDEVGAQEITQ